MTPVEKIIEDPIIQLLIFVILAIGVFDACKFVLLFFWKKISGEKDID